MLIRSQDKKSIVNLDSISVLEIKGYLKDDLSGVAMYYSGHETVIPDVWCVQTTRNLGEYTTEEKAMKVLEKLLNTYLSSCFTEINPYDGQTKLILNNLVFEMPEDSEV